MRLGILTQYYPPEIGAPQARLSQLAHCLVRAGHSVTVLTAMPSYPSGRVHPGYGGLFMREERDGVRVIRSAVFPTQSTALVPRLLNYASFLASSSVAGALLPRGMDCLLVESPPLFLGLAGYWLSRLKRARLIFNVSDLWPESAVQLGVLKPAGPAFRLSSALEAFCYRRAWLVTGQSKSILADISGRFPSCKTFHLSNGADTCLFPPPAEEVSRARARLRTGDETIVLYAGLHGLAQGLDQVLTAADRLAVDAGVRFVLIGDGPEKGALVQEAKRRHLANVTFLDAVPAREMPALLAAADIALVTLKTEIRGAVPSKLYEAMASARPVVLAATGEAADIVMNHDCGIVVSPGDSAGLASAVQTLRKQPHWARLLGENGRLAARAHFDRDAICSRFMTFLQSSLREHRVESPCAT